MILKFTPDNHKYVSIDEEDTTDWISVTSFIGNFKKPFEADSIAEKSSRNKKSKWYGLTPDEIKSAWKNEANRATTLGSWYHTKQEKGFCELETIQRKGVTVPIFKPLEIDTVKYSPKQKLEDGVYPEHLVYLKSAGVCGQSDLVEVVNGEVHITDYKTNKEIKTEGYKHWDGTVDKMLAPLSHLDDCNLTHYSLQLSMYMYMILKHNPKLKPGTLTIHHILFEEVDKDKWGNPITALDSNGDPIVKDIIPYTLNYLKPEVISLLHWLEDHRDKIKPHH